MIGYLVILWNPWDCQDVYKRVFLDLNEALAYVGKYELDKEKDEGLRIESVEVGS